MVTEVKRTLYPLAEHVRSYTFNSLPLQLGGQFGPVTLAYETWGTLNAAGDNAVQITHALTGNSHVHDQKRPDDAKVKGIESAKPRSCHGWRDVRKAVQLLRQLIVKICRH